MTENAFGYIKARMKEGSLPTVYNAEAGLMNGTSMETTVGTDEGIATSIDPNTDVDEEEEEEDNILNFPTFGL